MFYLCWRLQLPSVQVVEFFSFIGCAYTPGAVHLEVARVSPRFVTKFTACLPGTDICECSPNTFALHVRTACRETARHSCSSTCLPPPPLQARPSAACASPARY